jgi:hypothetical protein
MLLQNVNRGKTQKIVAILGTDNFTDEEVLNFAMEKTNEDKSSLFGWNVKRFENSADVYLYTD